MKIAITSMILFSFTLTGCAQNKSSAYDDCIKQYQKQADTHGGNGGIVGPKQFCNNKK